MNPSVSMSSQGPASLEHGSSIWQQLIQGKVGFLDALFPLFYHLFQNNTIPVLLYYLCATLWGLQTLFLGLWPFTKFWESNMTETETKIFKWLKAVCLFINHPYDTQQACIKEAVFFLLNVLSVICIIFNIHYYKTHRSFKKFLLLPLHPYLLIAFIGILPAGYNLGETYKKLIRNEVDAYLIVTIILGVFNVIYQLGFHYVSMNMYGKSVFITNMPFMAFDPLMNYIAAMVDTVIYLSTFILSYFADWACLIAIIANICFLCYLIPHLMNLLYVVHLSNMIIFAIFCSIICSNFMMFVAYFFPTMKHSICFIFLLAAYLFFSGISPIVLHFYRKYYIKKLSVTDESIISDRKEYFDSLKIKNSDKKALMLLTLGFKFACPLFTDFSLIEYLFDENTSTYLLSHLTQIVNFFPGETTMLNRMTGLLMSRRDLSIGARFLIYQIYKIKTIRQYSASSAESNSKLNELRNTSLQVEYITRSALESHDLKPGYYEELAKRSNRTNAIWQEALNEYPNNAKFYDEYSRYLVEAESNYPDAIYARHKSNMIEMGKNYSVDYCLRSMIRCFPVYIKNQIIDAKGNLLGKKFKKSKSETNFTSHSDGSDKEKTDELDDDVMESVGRSTISQYKTRIALHNALKNKLPKSITSLIPITIIVLLLICLMAIFIVIFSRSKIKKQTMSMELLDGISKTRFYIALNDMEILMRYSVDKGSYEKYETLMRQLAANCSSKDYLINAFKDFLYQSFFNLQSAISEYDGMMNDLADFANAGYDVYNISKNLIQTKHQLYTCYGGYPIYIVNDTVSTMITILLAHQSYIVTRVNDNISDMFTLHQFCELIVNLRLFYMTVPQIFTDFCDFQIREGENLQKKFKFILYTLPVIVTLLAFIPILIIHYLINRSLREITQIIESFDTKTKTEAKELISVNTKNDENVTLSEMSVTSNESGVLIAIICIVGLMFVAIIVAMTMLSFNSNKDIVNLNKWDQYATLRLSLTAEVMNTLTFGVAQFDNPNSTRVSTPAAAQQMVDELLEELMSVNHDLIQGTQDSPACNGFDSILDNENFVDNVINDTSNLDIHSIYENSSINSQLKVFYDYVSTTSREFTTSTAISKVPYAHSVHLLSYHLSPKMLKVTTRLKELADVTYNKLVLTNALLIIPLFVLVIVFAILVSVYYNLRRDTYNTSLYILKRINPVSLVNNKLFSNRFLKHANESTSDNKTVSGNIIYNSQDAIFFTNSHGIVEIVNPAATTLLGYTPEQTLGQSVSVFFVQDDENKVHTQMEMILKGQASPFFEDDVTAVTDSCQYMPCKMTIIGVKSPNSSEIKSFVLLLRDQTVLIEQQKQAELAKANSEKLLYQILPRDIVLQINRGEKDISFTVPSASIVFIDVVKFSDYSSSLIPQEIMSNLSFYFNTLDTIMTKFELLTKIKLIGDIYMAAGGLFNPELSPQKHAEQIVLFSTEVIGELEEINLKLNSSLSVRVGVNTGGPIIAGVLGKDKPVFDIIGDPINIASRLQSTDIANHVQISQSTFELISSLNLNIKPRGEVFLKGKGKQMTYLVVPNSIQDSVDLEIPMQLSGTNLEILKPLSSSLARFQVASLK
ncbi:Adenylate and Guanylate cyclase catalytic domain containing protein [Trichomonas vaginalis G3]|uniref:Adenylate and Guanylate cyclase catalytic domain containing protein n=1 Tax=Trichomonas vaginalis (strain ATCC PRA-98 / G3) TaxID=412133 RepID=A2EYR6_TRIV3|nr:guanylate cyclase protein [Trichomonas vaginalis G3]EAY02213.1 Adenylate and Guanylate cyclase catalytic domain containing protein [Trichomonas vaginalis G3]KAI5501027.1 guanylate cyclase protein [Trichomonas vaginalis G3]|eukprot:XP_001314551.1 Adenylate and Guanylate cyclase catalytic domain containing protein [Trichomonas vaginalis G3]